MLCTKKTNLLRAAGPKISPFFIPATNTLRPSTQAAPIHTSGPSRSATASLPADKSLGFNLTQQFDYLHSVVKTLPYVFEQKTESKNGQFVFPLGTLFKAPTSDIAISMADTFACALREQGVVAIELGFESPDSQILLKIVEAMGCQPDTHSSTQGALWDVTFKPQGVYSEALGKSAHSISHGLGEFTWHTDGAFEAKPQRFFGFHILHPDKKGGGVFRCLQTDRLVSLLSREAVEALTTHEFDLIVPDEFYKGARTIKGKLLEFDEKGNALLRYRADILSDPPSADEAANAAVREMRSVLEPPEKSGQAMPEEVFKENVILLMDNARFLHCRNDIKDPRRHLRRVRFHGTPGGKTG